MEYILCLNWLSGNWLDLKGSFLFPSLAADAFFDLLAWKAVKVNKQGTLAII